MGGLLDDAAAPAAPKNDEPVQVRIVTVIAGELPAGTVFSDVAQVQGAIAEAVRGRWPGLAIEASDSFVGKDSDDERG